LKFLRACMTRENFRLSLLIGLGLILLGFIFSGLLYLAYAHTSSPITWQQALSVGLTQCYSWSFIGYGIFWLAKRFPIERQCWVRGALIYLGIGIAAVYLKPGLDVILILAIYNNTDATKSLDSSLLVMMLYFNLLTYGTAVGIGHALNFHRKYREGEINPSIPTTASG
jgi:hypothetical protein